jgi:hypothetical protein
MGTLVDLRPNKAHQAHLQAETRRVLDEASEMLSEVRARRTKVEAVITSLPAQDLEAVIAQAYHGKRRAEAQLRRTQLSRTEVLKAFDSANAV